MEINKEFIIKMAENLIPLHQFLGLKVLSLESGYAKVRVPFKKEVVGDVRNNRWHGGIIATIMDSVGGIVGSTYGSSTKDKMATIDLRVDYLKAAQDSALIVEGELVRLGNRIMVVRMRAFSENDENNLIAEGKGVYNFIRMQKKKRPIN
ncbi:hotdog fold thioesterase [Mesonia aquimarina]|uniref:hotdog fold thioesterase n=1 Tax=Mesonia aquimarina TaxID=1504967 RepID=UPI000EF62C6F|nr:hotdog fold thioesterase [Mesonia aquimarina]